MNTEPGIVPCVVLVLLADVEEGGLGRAGASASSGGISVIRRLGVAQQVAEARHSCALLVEPVNATAGVGYSQAGRSRVRPASTRAGQHLAEAVADARRRRRRRTASPRR